MNNLLHKIIHNRFSKIIILLIVLIGVFVAYKKIASLQNEKDRLVSMIESLQGTPANKTNDEKKILEKVSKLIVLPENEQPTIFTIINANALSKEQPFFSGATDGDYLIVYRQSQKAIIYSATNRKIVNSGPIISSIQTKPEATSTTSKKK